MNQPIYWIGFNLLILGLLALDLGVFHKKAHVVSTKEALGWSVVWITLSMAFNALIYFWQGPDPALKFFTGYLIEKSLSVDNIFIFILIFGHFHVPPIYQHKILFWGILGALLMRAALIAVGAALIAKFHWILYIFGGFLVYTGIHMALSKQSVQNLEDKWAVRMLKRVMPVSHQYHEDHFWTRINGVLHATPMFVVLIIVETTDLIFAVDSIPAIFAITTDPFLVYTSNVFAILGLRSLYFALAGVIDKFCYLKAALSVILCFVGVKMLVVDFYKVPVGMSLGVIAGVLAVAVVASILKPAEIKVEC